MSKEIKIILEKLEKLEKQVSNIHRITQTMENAKINRSRTSHKLRKKIE